MLAVEIIGDREAARAFSRFAAYVDDMSRPLGDLAREGEGVAREVAPVLSGALVSSIVGEASRSEATVTAEAEYAGVQNYGWPARNIEASRFMEAGEEAIDRRSVDEVEDELERIARVVGLN